MVGDAARPHKLHHRIERAHVNAWTPFVRDRSLQNMGLQARTLSLSASTTYALPLSQMQSLSAVGARLQGAASLLGAALRRVARLLRALLQLLAGRAGRVLGLAPCSKTSTKPRYRESTACAPSICSARSQGDFGSAQHKRHLNQHIQLHLL